MIPHCDKKGSKILDIPPPALRQRRGPRRILKCLFAFIAAMFIIMSAHTAYPHEFTQHLPKEAINAFFDFSSTPLFKAQSGNNRENGQSRPVRVDDSMSYFHGLLVIFGFIIGVWLTVILMIAVSWRLKNGERERKKNAGAVQKRQEDIKNCGDEAESPLLAKIGFLRKLLSGMRTQVERIDPAAPPEIAKAQSIQVQERLDKLLLKADDLVGNMAEEMSAEPCYNNEPDSCALDVKAEYAAESPEEAEMHIRARSLRIEGCRLLLEDKNREALACFEEALALLKKLAPANPHNQLWQRDLVLVYHNKGRAMEAMEMYTEALDYFNEGLNIARKQVDQNAGSLDWKRGLAASHSHLGRIASLLGNLDDAWKNFDKEIDILKYMCGKQPENKPWQYALASACHNMGQLLERMGKSREALEVYKKDQAILKKLVDSDPENLAWLYDLACVHGHLARMYKEQGRLKDALGNARRYLGAMRKLSEREPGNITWRRELTVALGQVGRLLELRGEYDQARTTFNATLEIRRNLADLEPANSVLQDDLLVCLYKMGDVCMAQKDYDEAWRYYQESLKFVEDQIAKDGRQDNWRMGKCGVLLRLGNLHRADDAVVAANYYQSALTIAEENREERGRAGDWQEMVGLIKKSMGQGETVTVQYSGKKSPRAFVIFCNIL